MAERWTFNPRVAGSILAVGTLLAWVYMLSRWHFIGVTSLTTRLTFQAWSLNLLKAFQLRRFMPSKTTRGVLPDGLLLAVISGQISTPLHIVKERQYDVGLSFSSVSGLSIYTWSYRMWSFFFQQTEQLSILKMATGQKSGGYFRSRFRRYVFFEETRWLRETYKNSINNVALNFGIKSRDKCKALVEFVLRFCLLPIKIRPSSKSRNFYSGWVDRTNHLAELFKRYRWLKAYRAHLLWAARHSKVLRVQNEVGESFKLGFHDWIFNYKAQHEEKRKKKKKRRRQRTNTRFKRRRFGKKRLRLKAQAWSRKLLNLLRHKLFTPRAFTKQNQHFYYFHWGSFWKIYSLLGFQYTLFLRSLYWDFRKLKKRYKDSLSVRRSLPEKKQITYFKYV